MFMSTPDHAWQILTSDILTDNSLNFVSSPSASTMVTNYQLKILEEFVQWPISDQNKNGFMNLRSRL